MGFLRRKTDDDRTDASAHETERAGPSPGLVRAFFTLGGVAAAGFLIWLAQTSDWQGSTAGFWIAAGLLAAAGLVLGLSQLFGGWTKWGWPTLSPSVFLFAFLPALIVGGWILLARQPVDEVEEGRIAGWTNDLGIGGLVDALFEFWPAIPLVIGLILAFSFDTTGPRTRIVREREQGVPDEDVHDYRRETVREREPIGAGATTTDRHTDVTRVDDGRSDATVAEELRDRDVPADDGERRRRI